MHCRWNLRLLNGPQPLSGDAIDDLLELEDQLSDKGDNYAQNQEAETAEVVNLGSNAGASRAEAADSSPD